MKFLGIGHLLHALAACVATGSIEESHPGQLHDGNGEEPIRNVNHMFNAIRGAMRQWDNSWNHNGMSFFVATVPQGVQLYHGTARSEPIKGMEWLAFEPEHALMFARPRMRRPPPGHRGPGEHPPPPSLHEAPDHDHPPPHGPPRPPPLHHPPPPPTHRDPDRPHYPPNFSQQRFIDDRHRDHESPGMQSNSSGYLQFYRTSHDLKLVYIDGMSAGKTSKGTLDTQDYILALNKYNSSNSPSREGERADALCNLARTAWSGRIDGFIRMESGFEIVLCDFEVGLKFERAQEVKFSRHYEREDSALSPFRLYRAIADRFNGIGGGRVLVDYASFVSAFDWNFASDLFVEDKVFPGQLLPRLDGQDEDDLLALQKGIVDTIDKSVRGKLQPTIDWQAIAEMFVQRYTAPLRFLADTKMSRQELKRELRSLLRPFVSDRIDDPKVITQRCVEQFVPQVWSVTLAGRVVHQIASELCGTLVKTLHDVESSKHHEIARTGQHAIADLASYLDWPIWHECSPSCRYDEVCVLPIWPLTSSIADRKAPACKNLTAYSDGIGRPAQGNTSYWWDGGAMHPPPPPPHW